MENIMEQIKDKLFGHPIKHEFCDQSSEAKYNNIKETILKNYDEYKSGNLKPTDDKYELFSTSNHVTNSDSWFGMQSKPCYNCPHLFAVVENLKKENTIKEPLQTYTIDGNLPHKSEKCGVYITK